MIPFNSRYDKDGYLVNVPSRDRQSMEKVVYRMFEYSTSGKFGHYTWRDGDRIDKVAVFFLGDPGRWWEIMDLNPEIHSTAELAPGMSIRVPLDRVGDR